MDSQALISTINNLNFRITNLETKNKVSMTKSIPYFLRIGEIKPNQLKNISLLLSNYFILFDFARFWKIIIEIDGISNIHDTNLLFVNLTYNDKISEKLERNSKYRIISTEQNKVKISYEQISKKKF